ncbi:kynurenine aminotransferase-like [Artemia franciscana]|uniref:kynurenine aminotransferase-like n=1 Tax=Artemia franciscana TaxID=6661 RepID=UPI0032DACE7E
MLRRFTKLLQFNQCQRILSCASLSSSSMSEGKFKLADKYKGLETNVWVEFIQLALEQKPLNLGQGFPDFAAPDHVTKSLADVATGENLLMNQYTRGYGHPRLVQALASFYGKLVGRSLDPYKNILVGAGAYEALFCGIMSTVNGGDEVIIIEPFFDCYEPMVRLAGGTPVFIPLKPKGDESTSENWVLDEEELRSKFTSKTKAIIINTPHNPLGKIFNRAELQVIADLCIQHDVLCMSDEVYEWLVYAPNEHVRIATLPGMWERTITVGSAGKTFSVTGWKLGWAYGPENLIKNLGIAHQNCVYTCSTPLQEACARGFELEMSRFGTPDCYFQSLAAELLPKRDYMAKFLSENGMKPVVPQGGYFMVANWTELEKYSDLSQEPDPLKDYKFVKWLSKTKKLQGIPPSAFYSKEHKRLGENYIRFCFIKQDSNLKKADEILTKWKSER